MKGSEKMYRMAVSYFAGAFVIYRHMTPTKTYKAMEPLPYILTLSFALELFLKVILKEEGKERWSHKPSTLYRILSKGSKDLLFESYIAVLQEIKDKGPLPEQKAFEEEIKKLKDPFTEWRYIYESSGGNMIMLGFLHRLCVAAMHVCSGRNPKWEKHSELIKRVSKPQRPRGGTFHK